MAGLMQKKDLPVVITLIVLLCAFMSVVLYAAWIKAMDMCHKEVKVIIPSSESLKLQEAVSEFEASMQDYMVSVFAAELVLREHGKEMEDLYNLILHVEDLYEKGVSPLTDEEVEENEEGEEDEEVDPVQVKEGGDLEMCLEIEQEGLRSNSAVEFLLDFADEITKSNPEVLTGDRREEGHGICQPKAGRTPMRLPCTGFRNYGAFRYIPLPTD